MFVTKEERMIMFSPKSCMILGSKENIAKRQIDEKTKNQKMKRFRRQLTKGRLNLAAKNIVAKKAKDKTKRSPESSDSCCQVSHCSELSAAKPLRRCLLDRT